MVKFVSLHRHCSAAGLFVFLFLALRGPAHTLSPAPSLQFVSAFVTSVLL